MATQHRHGNCINQMDYGTKPNWNDWSPYTHMYIQYNKTSHSRSLYTHSQRWLTVQRKYHGLVIIISHFLRLRKPYTYDRSLISKRFATWLFNHVLTTLLLPQLVISYIIQIYGHIYIWYRDFSFILTGHSWWTTRRHDRSIPRLHTNLTIIVWSHVITCVYLSEINPTDCMCLERWTG